MRQGIHPEYNKITVSCVCGNEFVTGSILGELRLDICSACHPFFTGTQKIVDTEGRVDKFKKKFAQKADAKKKDKRKPRGLVDATPEIGAVNLDKMEAKANKAAKRAEEDKEKARIAAEEKKKKAQEAKEAKEAAKKAAAEAKEAPKAEEQAKAPDAPAEAPKLEVAPTEAAKPAEAEAPKAEEKPAEAAPEAKAEEAKPEADKPADN